MGQQSASQAAQQRSVLEAQLACWTGRAGDGNAGGEAAALST
jgi:hypothetical protein